MFYSYFNMNANLMGGEFAKTVRSLGLKKGAGRLLYIYAMAFMIPAVTAELISRGIRGNPPGDDDDDDTLGDAMSVFFGSQFRLATAMVPVIGPVVAAAVGDFTKNPFDDKITGSPAITVLEGAVKAPKEVYDTIINGEDWGKKDTKDLLTLMGLMSGLPLRPLATPINYLTQD